MILLIVFCCGTPPSCLKVMGWVVVGGGGGGGLEQFSVSPRPLGFEFGTKWFGAKGFGPGLDKSPTYKLQGLSLSTSSWLKFNFQRHIYVLVSNTNRNV